jgi:hypothetical protein
LTKIIYLLFNYGVGAKELEFFPYKCPHCSAVRNATEVANELPPEVLLRRTRPLVGSLRRKRRAGPGRPSMPRCPGCSHEMPTDDLKKHRIDCVRAELQRLTGTRIQLEPKDPDPYPTFYMHQVGDYEVQFQKGSNHDIVTVDLRKIAEITADGDNTCYIRVLGRVVWLEDIKRWRFAPTAIGRPPLERTQRAN